MIAVASRTGRAMALRRRCDAHHGGRDESPRRANIGACGRFWELPTTVAVQAGGTGSWPTGVRELRETTSTGWY